MLAVTLVTSLSACGGQKPATPAGTQDGQAQQQAPTGQQAQASTTAQAPQQPASQTAKLAPLSPPVKIWIAEDGSPSGAGFYIAKEKGYFAEFGIEADIRPFESSKDMLPAIASDEVQVAGGILGANLFNAVSRGLNIKIIADKGTNNPGKSYYSMVVRKDLAGQIKDYKDLKGHKIGLFSVGTLNEYTVEKALLKGGLTVKDVELVPLGPPDISVALARKSIDLGMHIEPLITQGVKQGIFERWKDTTDFLPDAQIAVVLASPKFVANEALSKRFMVAYLRALRDYNDAFLKGKGKDQIIDILAKYTDLKDKSLWNDVYVTGLNPNGQVNVKSLEDQLQWYKEKGTVTGNVDLNHVVDLSLAKFAVEYLGGEYK
ncbi:hypothetical protein caldi_01290 [Caldinitratiruptor microaerophilus]|uniref:SsuA/THI5-like domain-containing protein n=1 Tax=Caldinitratiruptor microaerophilus TaxID=671077 RepID=A0AA35CHG4_9FIRM|nr:hypothetical protein caldi_01290 [Caldinitratiruptor microaerophilus]